MFLHVATIVLVVVPLAFWLFCALSAARTVRGIPDPASLRPKMPGVWPRLSVIMTACKEEGTLRDAMTSKLADGYTDAEFIVVDDRSIDGTGTIIDALAASDERVKPLHLTTLPPDWLGKVHAMHRAAQVATGDWILFSDADVHLAPGTLRRAIAYCEMEKLDHLALLPEV